MTPCQHHRAVLRRVREHGHLTRTVRKRIAAALTRQCPSCIKESTHA